MRLQPLPRWRRIPRLPRLILDLYQIHRRHMAARCALWLSVRLALVALRMRP